VTEQAADPTSPAKYEVGNHSLCCSHRGDEITVQPADEGIRFLLYRASPSEDQLCLVRPDRDEQPGAMREANGRTGKPATFSKHR